MDRFSPGADMGACDNVRMGNLTLTLARIAPAEDRTMTNLPADQRNSKNPDFVRVVGLEHVLEGRANTRQNSEILAEMEAGGKIRIVDACYDFIASKFDFIE